MTYKELTAQYLASPQYTSLADNSKRMYKTFLDLLVQLGGHLPLADRDMPNSVALSRSPENVAPNLCGIWFALIDTKKSSTNPMKLGMRTGLSITYKWAVLKGYINTTENFVPSIPKAAWKHQSAPMHPYRPADMEAFEKGVVNGTIPASLAPYAMFTVIAFDMGCRPDEMYDHHKDWFLKRDGDTYYEVHEAKGKAKDGVSRYVLLGEREKRIIKWFKSVPAYMGFENHTFRTDKGRAFCQSLISTRVKEVCRLLGVEERKFYETRHGLATAMYEAGHSDEDVSDRIGSTVEVVRRNYIQKDLLIKAKRGAPLKLRGN